MEIIVTQPLNIESSSSEEQQSQNKNPADFSQRAQYLRAVVLGGNEGLVAIAFLLIGAITTMDEPKDVLVTCFAGLIAGAFGIAVAEFVSCYTQVDITKSHAKRNNLTKIQGAPNPIRIALAAWFAYIIAGIVPLLAASFVINHKVRISIAVSMACLSMLGLGTIGASLGKAPIARSCARVLAGGCVEVMILLAKKEVLYVYGIK